MKDEPELLYVVSASFVSFTEPGTDSGIVYEDPPPSEVLVASVPHVRAVLPDGSIQHPIELGSRASLRFVPDLPPGAKVFFGDQCAHVVPDPTRGDIRT